MSHPAIVWFRRDLRLADHLALATALAEHPSVVPLFVIDPVLWRASGAPRRAYLRACLDELDRSMGEAMVLRHGDPAEVVTAAAAECGARTVYVSRDFGPYGRRRDAAVAERLAATGVRFRGVGSPYVVEPGIVRKSDGGAYAEFTPFAKAWGSIPPAAPLGEPRDPSWIGLMSDGLPDADEPVGALSAGELAAHERLEGFAAGAIDNYREARNIPGIDGTSRLSAALKWGTLHPRQVLAEIGATGDPANADRRTFATELAWREFYADVLFRRPETVRENLDHRMDAMAVDTDAAARERFTRWATGTTGFPIVDAGMRQLAATGWMHNRVRMITASFLVKDLHLPWQWGARHFMQHLVDGDVASNSHGWQWVAGTGTDAAPFFRVFNPSAQAERFDPDGSYVEQWVPEAGTDRYIGPMVDHAAERAEALARYEALRRR